MRGIKMKYTKMVCWVDKKEKKELNKANNLNIPIIFAKNKDEFVSFINKDVFPVISIKKAFHINTVRNIVRAFPNIRFYAMMRLDDAFTTPNEFSFIIDEPNVANKGRSQYISSELILLFSEGQYINQ
jgi:hypothetical protein